ncbi:MAG: Penicillinase repressor [Gemmatimonadetes bacterium]|nr:Penicillinase repressor [Gemmatimonadota bacterium]
MPAPRFTEREIDVMQVLWQTGSATVAEAREALGLDLAYTTVLWALQTLEEKGHVRHEQEGRAYRYYATVAPEAAGGRALDRILDKAFHGSASVLLAQLVSERDVSTEELEAMRDLLDKRLAERKK